MKMSLTNSVCLKKDNIESFLDSFDDILCDCDGVVWKLNSPIPGVTESISTLKHIGKKVHFVSNNCTHTLDSFKEKLNNFQIDAETDDIAYPILAICGYLKKINFTKEIFLLGMPVMRQQFEAAGIKVSNTKIDRIEGNLESLSAVLQDNPEIGAVVVEIDLNLSYIRLLQAAVYLQRPEVLFITGGTDKKIPTGFVVPFIGPGHFEAILEDLTGRASTRFGKPAKEFNNFIVGKFNITNPSRTLFIGDNLIQDMEFAGRSGYKKLLVLTGVTNMEQLSNCTNPLRIPDYYINSLGDLHELINN